MDNNNWINEHVGIVRTADEYFMMEEHILNNLKIFDRSPYSNYKGLMTTYEPPLASDINDLIQ